MLTSDPVLYRKAALYGAYVTFNIGRSSMFLLFLGLIHYTSKDTKYDYPICIKCTYLILALFVPMILIAWSTYDRWFSYDEELFQIRRYLDHANTVTLCLFSALLFCRVLVRVAWNQLLEDQRAIRSPMSCVPDKEAEERIQKLLDLITKYTILTLAIVFMSLVVVVMDEMTWS